MPTHCDTCGHVIGVYEPMIVVSPAGEVVETSVAALGEVAPRDGHHHPACYGWKRASSAIVAAMPSRSTSRSGTVSRSAFTQNTTSPS